ncbi:MAG TPA: DNA translocase FtsK [Pyrinomonadaceae bacterium]
MSITARPDGRLKNVRLGRIASAARQAVDDQKLLQQHTLDDVVEQGDWLIINQPRELFEAAERRARAELALAPESAAAHARLARCLRWLARERPWREQEEMAREAEQLCAEAIALDEQNELARLDAAAILLWRARWESDTRAKQLVNQALDYCDPALDSEQWSYRAKSLHGEGLRRLALLAPARAEAVELYEKSLRELREALESRLDYYPALAEWGYVLLNRANREIDGPEADDMLAEAAARFEEALAIHPLYEKALCGLAAALADRAKFYRGHDADRLYASALGALEQAVTAHPHSFSSLNIWGNIVVAQARRRGGTEARRLCALAADKYNSSLSLKPDNPFTFAQLGSLHLFEAYEAFGAETPGLAEKARERIGKGLAFNPDFRWGRTLMSSALRLQAEFVPNEQVADKLRLAVDNCQAALSSRADDPVALEEWARALRAQAERTGRLKAVSLLRAAVESISEGIKTWPHRESLMVIRGECLSALAQRQTWSESATLMNESVETFEDALDVWPHSHNALRGLGKALVFLARRAGAREVDSAFGRAYEKFSAALLERPEAHTVLSDWGEALRLHAEMRPGQRERLLRESEQKIQSALSTMPGHVYSQVALALTLRGKAGMTMGAGADEDLNTASRLLYEAIESHPLSTFALCALGNTLIRQAKRRSPSESLRLLTEALSLFDRALQVRPDYAWALESSGQALIEQASIVSDASEAQRLYSAADERFRDSLQLEPDSPGRLMARAIALRQRARRSPQPEASRLYEETYRLLIEAKNAWPASATPNFHWANTVASEAQQAHDDRSRKSPEVEALFASADALFDDAQALDDSNWEIYRERALALVSRARVVAGVDADHWYSEAAGLLDQALSLNAVPELILRDRANLFLTRARKQPTRAEREEWYDRALADLREAARVNPNYDDALYDLARALHDHPDTQTTDVPLHEVNVWYARAHATAPFRAEILLDWARLLRRRRHYQAAKEKARAALDLNPDNADAHWNIAETLRVEADNAPDIALSLLRLGEAEAHLREGIQLRVNAASLHAALAETLAQHAGKTDAEISKRLLEEAIREYDQALRLEPSASKWLAARATVLSRLAKADEAAAARVSEATSDGAGEAFTKYADNASEVGRHLRHSAHPAHGEEQSAGRAEPVPFSGVLIKRPAPEDGSLIIRTSVTTFGDYQFPRTDFLTSPAPPREQADEELLQIAQRIAEKCKEFNVTGQIKHIRPGPVVTTYEFKPDPGVKYSRIIDLADEFRHALEVESIRIDRPPRSPHLDIEVPNPERETIFMREVLESRQFRESPSKLTLALGKTIDGINYTADLTRMPHLLIAGATGTGKSVCLNSLVVSILYKARPDEVKFVMIDPKRLELGLYADIPHLATPIITEPKKAANALKWAVREMEQRYKKLAQWGVRNIDGYNTEVERRNNILDFDEDGNPHKTLPYVVIIIDELADLMMTCGADVEEAITRLAQMARAVGIHLVLATQRPSVDVITGLIKANFPSRIAFRVSQKVDSRTIIDANGAEQLLGRGDMLFLPPGTSRLLRVHGAFLDENEVAKIVAHIKAQGGAPVYDETITQSEEESGGGEGGSGERDELFDQALRICCEMNRASTSVLQRRLRIGYGRAAAILDGLEREGFIGAADGARPRPILDKAFETVNEWDDLQEDGADDS